MAPEKICKLLKDKFAEAIEDSVLEGGHPYARVAPQSWREVARFLFDDRDLSLNLLRSITALDLVADDKLACIYDLMHVPMALGPLATETIEFAIRIEVDRNEPVIPSVWDIWPAADWHEREAFDMMGIRFSGHPDLRRILCPDDWVGFPLRKDYEFPLEYHGIPATTEYELTNPRH